MSATPEQLRDAFKKLPLLAREFVASPELVDMLEGYAKKANLDEKQTNALIDVVSEMVVGIGNRAELSKTLASAGIDPSRSTLLIRSVETEIFKRVDDLIKGTVAKQKAPAGPPVVVLPPKPTPQRRETALPTKQAVPSLAKPAVPVLPKMQAALPPHASKPSTLQPPPPKPQAPIPATAKPVAQAPAKPLAAPPARPRITVAPHQVRTFAKDVAQAKGAPPPSPAGPLPKPVRPPIWEGASVKPAAPMPSKTENAQELAATLKKYGIDPYREPIE